MGIINWAAVAIAITVLGSIISFAYFIGRLTISKMDKDDCELRRRECAEMTSAAACRTWDELNAIRTTVAENNATFKTQIGNLESVTERLEMAAIKINGG